MALTAIPAQFGAGGVGLQGTRYGSPSLRALLEEHRAAIATLQAADGVTIARIATTANHGLSGLTAIDGKTPVAGNTILVKSQSSADEHGLYVAASGAWTRLKDATGADVIAAGMIVQVLEGTANGDSQWFLSTDDPIVVDTTNLTFTQIPNLADLASTSNGLGASLIGIEDSATLITATDVEGALAELAGLKVRKLSVDIVEGDLTAAATTETLNLGAALPANARILNVDLHTYTPFTGGSVSAMTADIGSATDLDALVDGVDLFTAAVDGAPADHPLGIRPNKFFSASTQLQVKFDSTGDNVDACTAGAVTVDVIYVVLA